jgi:capsule biosynthesis phosphatase
VNIIIPLGGIGERFKKEGYSLPKPLVRVNGTCLLNLVLQKLKTSQEDTIFIIYNKVLDDYQFSNIIKFHNKNLNIKFIEIDFKTRGAAETILCGLNTFTEEQLNDLTLSIDCDTYYDDDIITACKKINDNLIFYFTDTDTKPIYSYIEFDQSNRVYGIKEKIKISDNANVGAYCFKNGTTLKKYCEILTDTNLSDKKEYYVSNIYATMLTDGHQVKAEKIENFKVLGTPEQLQTYCLTTEHAKKRRFCFDLDNTLVTYPQIDGDYSSVLPIKKAVEYVRFLKSHGHTIIIHTARRMKTHNGNVNAVVADIGKVTIETLEKFNIPYDEICFGKPYADFYIDDLSANPFVDMEKQTGYYMPTIENRKFNTIEMFENEVVKYSKSDSICGEIHWYKNIPEEISDLFPKLLDAGDHKLRIEKIHGIPVSLLYTNLSLTKSHLHRIFDSIDRIHNIRPYNIKKFYGYYTKKLIERHELINYATFSPSSELTFVDLMGKLIKYEETIRLTCIHGDPVFTNILISNNSDIKFIDMRGMVNGELTICGDYLYDIAKIYQSIIGYDFIHAGKEPATEYINKMKLICEAEIVARYGEENLKKVKLICASLLFTLIPLHSDMQKQQEYYNLIEGHNLL